MDRRAFLKSAAGAAGVLVWAAAGQEPVAEPVVLHYPDDAFSRPPEDRLPAFTTLAGAALAMGAAERAAHYARNELRTLPALDGVEWVVVPTDLNHAALNVTELLRRAPVAIRCRVRNKGERPLTLQLLTPEVPWRPQSDSRSMAWAVGDPVAIPPGADVLARFVWSEVTPISAGDHAEPCFPTNALLFSLAGLVPGEETRVVLSDLVVEYPWAGASLVESILLPGRSEAGEVVEIEVSAAIGPGSGAVDLEFRREPWVLWRTRLAEAEAFELGRSGRLPVQRRLPWHLASEVLTVGLVVGGYRVQGAEGALEVAGAPPGAFPRMEIREHLGRPMPFREGEPFLWWGYSSYDFQPGSVTEFGAHGTDSFCIPVGAGSHLYSCAALPNWVGPQRWDFGQLEERVGFCLAANPDAHLSLRLNLTLPPFWHEEHPDERALVDLGDRRVVWSEPGALPAASLASDVWRADQEEALRKVLGYVRSRPWASRVYAVCLTGEVTEEWFSWASNDGHLSDYSPPNQRAFGVWLGARGYEGAEEPEPVPSAAWRTPEGTDLLRDIPQERRAAAYQQYANDLHAEVLERFAAVTKEETGRRVLVGAFVGYVVQLAGEPRQATAGHMALRRVLEDPNIDFLAGVPLLDFRTWPEGYVGHGSATESICAHGKLYLVENDLFSWLHPLHWHQVYNAADPRGGAVDMHERVLAGDAVRGTLAQRFSLMCSWHHDAGLQEAFSRHREVYAEALCLDRTPVSQVAFVVDDTSFAWMAASSRLGAHSNRWMLRATASTGAGIGVWLLSDLDLLPPETRLVVVASAPAPRPEDLARLSDALAGGGRTFVLVGTPGLVDPDLATWQPHRTLELLGLPLIFRSEGGQGGAVVRATGEWVCGNDGFFSPRLDGPDGSLLRYPDGPGASAERPLPGGGRLIWCGAPVERPDILRQWMVEAGVHCTAPEGCVVHVARGLASVCSPREGTVRLEWPEHVGVRDLVDGWTGQGSSLECPFRAGQTRIFEVRPSRDERGDIGFQVPTFAKSAAGWFGASLAQPCPPQTGIKSGLTAHEVAPDEQEVRVGEGMAPRSRDEHVGSSGRQANNGFC